MLSVAAVRATLSEVLTDEAFARMIPLAGRWADGVQGVIDEFGLPWVVKQLGCRAEYWPRPVPPRNGGEAAAAEDEQLDRYLHLFMLNRGILMTPFHNMALMCAADHGGGRRPAHRATARGGADAGRLTPGRSARQASANRRGQRSARSLARST